MKITTIILTALVLVAACRSAPKQTEAEIKAKDRFQWAVAVAAALRKAALNPEKFVVESALLGDGKVVCFRFRGENCYGGMTRHAVVLSDTEIVGETESEFASVWNRECASNTGEDKGRSVQTALGYLPR